MHNFIAVHVNRKSRGFVVADSANSDLLPVCKGTYRKKKQTYTDLHVYLYEAKFKTAVMLLSTKFNICNIKLNRNASKLINIYKFFSKHFSFVCNNAEKMSH